MPVQSDCSRFAAPTYRPLALIVCALATGIVVDRLYAFGAEWWALGAIAALMVWLALWLFRREQWASWLLLTCFFATGGAWHHSYWRLYAADEIGRMVQEESRPLCIEAIALTSPRWIPAPPPTPLR